MVPKVSDVKKNQLDSNNNEKLGDKSNGISLMLMKQEKEL